MITSVTQLERYLADQFSVNVSLLLLTEGRVETDFFRFWVRALDFCVHRARWGPRGAFRLFGRFLKVLVNPIVLCLEPALVVTITQAATSLSASVRSCLRAAACACQEPRPR